MQFKDIIYEVKSDYAHVTINRPKVLNAFTPVTLQELKTALDSAEKEHHFERALSSIYFLQKCLDFEKGGELAKNLFKVYEYCRVQIIDFALKGTVEKLDTAIEFVQTILEGWEGIKGESS